MKISMKNSVLAFRDTHAGFAMIEVLASLLILTVGLLSVAGLSANSLKASDTSAHRAHAARQVMEISEAIRANRQAAADGEFDVALSSTAVPVTSNVAIIGAVAQVKASLAQVPQGKVSIQYVEARDAVLITAEWNEDRTGSTSPSYSLEVRL
jgi:type IV pilus assembly protein PilV